MWYMSKEYASIRVPIERQRKIKNQQTQSGPDRGFFGPFLVHFFIVFNETKVKNLPTVPKFGRKKIRFCLSQFCFVP